MPKHKKYQVALSDHERETPGNFVPEGRKSAGEINRARIPLLSDTGKKDTDIAELLGVSPQTACSVRRKCNKGKYESVLDSPKEQSRSGRPVKIDTRTEAGITMTACSDPPEGHAEWTPRLIAGRAVRLETADTISHESAGKVLKKTD